MREESPPPSSFQAREEPWRLEKSTLHVFMISLAVQNLIVRLCCHPLGIERQSVLLSRLRRQVKERNQAFDKCAHSIRSCLGMHHRLPCELQGRGMHWQK